VQNFGNAANRHFRDAVLLEMNERLPNADQLAGFAAECALKEILIRFLGAQRTRSKPVSVHADGKQTSHGHLPPLWGEVAAALSGRSGGAFAGFLAENPFSSWSVDDRYSNGDGIAPNLVAARLAAARRILGYLQIATVRGALP